MLVRHSLAYIVTNLVAGLFGFATTLILTRLITPAEYGVFGLGVTLVYFASNLFFDWQATTYLRLGQGEGDRARMTGIFVGLFLVCVLLSLLLALPITLILPEALTGGRLVWFALPCLWCFAWFQFSVRVHMAALEPGRIMVMNVVRGAVGLIGAVTVAWITGNGAWTLLASFAGALAGSLVRPGALMHVSAPWRERAIVRDALAFGLPMALAFVISSVSPVINRVLLASMGSLDAAGFYAVGAVLVQNTIGLMAGGVGAAAYTLAVRAHETGEAGRAETQLASNFVLLLALLLPGAVGLALVAPGLMPHLVGAAFVEPAVRLTPIVATATFIGCMRAPCGYGIPSCPSHGVVDRAVWRGRTCRACAWRRSHPALRLYGAGLCKPCGLSIRLGSGLRGCAPGPSPDIAAWAGGQSVGGNRSHGSGAEHPAGDNRSLGPGPRHHGGWACLWRGDCWP
jgi:O-antigen/teichoic acid export membrane protein